MRAVHEYRPGRWTALVTDEALAVFHPDLSDDVARELWQLTSEGRRLGAWVEYLAAAGIATLPSFAMVESHPDGARVLVRGELTVTVDGRELSGRGYATWREEVVTTTQPVLVTAEEDGGAWLPVTGGIVRAGQVRATVSAADYAPPLADDDVEHTVARMPALAAAVGSSAAATPAAGAATAPAAPPAPAAPAAPNPEFAPPSVAGEQGPPAPQAAAAEPPSLADAAEAAAPAGPGAPSKAEPAETGAPGTPSAPADAAETAAPADSAEPVDVESTDDEYDFLLWPTEQGAQPSAEAPPVASPAPPPSPGHEPPADAGHVDLEATRAPEPDEEYEPEPAAAHSPEPAAVQEPAGIIDSVPRHLAPPTGAPVTPPPGAPVPAAADDTPGAPAPADDDGDHDGHTILTSEVPHSPPAPTSPAPASPASAPPADEPPRTELVLSTGVRVEMVRPVLIGRAPEAARFAGGETPRLMSVPNLDVSGTHVEIRPAGEHVVVTDMNSTNGTVVHPPAQPAFRLQPGTGVPVAPGAVIEIGEGLTIRVEPIEALA